MPLLIWIRVDVSAAIRAGNAVGPLEQLLVSGTQLGELNLAERTELARRLKRDGPCLYYQSSRPMAGADWSAVVADLRDEHSELPGRFKNLETT